MGFLSTHCTFSNLTEKIINNCESFDCGNSDLNDFFLKDSPNYSKELLGKSLIGRLGVNTTFKNRGIGKDLMDFIKSWFIDVNNKTGCRFIVVDAYNQEIPMNYYSKNGFDFLFSSEKQESKCNHMSDDSILATRFMFFDLATLTINSDVL